MKHTLILEYRNVDMAGAPLLYFDGPIAIPAVGDVVAHRPNNEARVTKRRFSMQDDEIRVVLTLDGDGQPEPQRSRREWEAERQEQAEFQRFVKP